MEEKQPWDTYEPPRQDSPALPAFPVCKPELIFGICILLMSLLLCNCLFFAGANLGVAVATTGCILCSFIYLHIRGCRANFYSGALLLLSLILAAGLARTDDGFVKFVCICFLLLSCNLAFCLMAGQNRWSANTFGSLLDASRAAFYFGVGYSPQVCRGLRSAFQKTGSVGQKGGAFLLGLCIAVPVVACMIPLLIKADAAFDGLMALLPEFEIHELVTTVITGSGVAFVCFVRGVALRHASKDTTEEKTPKGVSSVTVNTVLGAVCLLYAVYLFSQLAYLSGGFAGILPEEYTLAEYARRGFFEMALLSGGNLAVIVVSLVLVKKEPRSPLSTRLFCLFIGIVTLFLIVTASAKMFLYIDSYGLTRLRVLTQVIMLFLALTTLIVSIWLFAPKLPYMKIVLLAALTISAVTLWVDVDTLVAKYNVDAYLSGQLEQVDVRYLSTLGDGAVPHLARLVEHAPDQAFSYRARNQLKEKARQVSDADIREWNYVNYIAKKYLPKTE